MKYDPLYLWENKRSRFDKFVQRCISRAGGNADEDSGADSEPVKKKSKKTEKTSQAPSQTNVAAAAAAS